MSDEFGLWPDIKAEAIKYSMGILPEDEMVTSMIQMAFMCGAGYVIKNKEQGAIDISKLLDEISAGFDKINLKKNMHSIQRGQAQSAACPDLSIEPVMIDTESFKQFPKDKIARKGFQYGAGYVLSILRTQTKVAPDKDIVDGIKNIIYKLQNIGNRPDLKQFQEGQVVDLCNLFSRYLLDRIRDRPVKLNVEMLLPDDLSLHNKFLEIATRYSQQADRQRLMGDWLREHVRGKLEKIK